MLIKTFCNNKFNLIYIQINRIVKFLFLHFNIIKYKNYFELKNLPVMKKKYYFIKLYLFIFIMITMKKKINNECIYLMIIASSSNVMK